MRVYRAPHEPGVRLPQAEADGHLLESRRAGEDAGVDHLHTLPLAVGGPLPPRLEASQSVPDAEWGDQVDRLRRVEGCVPGGARGWWVCCHCHDQGHALVPVADLVEGARGGRELSVREAQCLQVGCLLGRTALLLARSDGRRYRLQPKIARIRWRKVNRRRYPTLKTTTP